MNRGCAIVPLKPEDKSLSAAATLSPIHTADADETKLFCRVGVGGVNTNSQLVGDSFVASSVYTPVGSRDPVYNFLC